ncbi:MAG TPA: hypothetical protein VJR89_13890 [Polyangiales bacterium]|nr:hypothetical protein [Polyangiales bacterium]
MEGASAAGRTGWRAAHRGIERANVHALAVDTFWPAVGYAAAADGLYRTITAGAWWRLVSAVPADGGLNVVTDPNRFGVAYAGGAIGDGHLYETEDAGSTWRANAALDARERGPGEAPYARPLAIASGDSSVMYAVVDGVRQLFLARTNDAGETWSVGPGPGDRGACCLAMLAPSASHAYLSTLAQAPSLYETVDGGASWTRLTLDLSYIESLAIDPYDSNVLYAAGLAHDAEGPTQGVLRKSIDAGATWFDPSTQLAQYAVDAVSVSNVDGRVYLTVRDSVEARDSIVLVSRDGAASFENASAGLDEQAVQAVVPISGLRCGAYAATREAGVFKTYSSGGACR